MAARYTEVGVAPQQAPFRRNVKRRAAAEQAEAPVFVQLCAGDSRAICHRCVDSLGLARIHLIPAAPLAAVTL
jgi:hypothetical protein